MGTSGPLGDSLLWALTLLLVDPESPEALGSPPTNQTPLSYRKGHLSSPLPVPIRMTPAPPESQAANVPPFQEPPFPRGEVRRSAPTSLAPGKQLRDWSLTTLNREDGIPVTGEEGVPGPGEALVWPPPAEGEACPGHRELLSFGSKSS